MTLTRITILHVDDDQNDLVLFQHACRKTGMTAHVQTARDGDEAVAYLQGSDEFADRAKHPLPNLMLLDLKMPRLSGFDVLAWVRGQSSLRRLPVIVLSSSKHSVDVERAYDLGANSYLVKPSGFEALMQMAKAIEYYWITWNELADSRRETEHAHTIHCH
jgi:CheY-like chemotaxis protein